MFSYNMLIAIPLFLYFSAIPIFKKILYFSNNCGELEVSCLSSLQNYFYGGICHVDDGLWMVI